MNNKLRKKLHKIIAAALFFVVAMFLGQWPYVQVAMFVAAYLLTGTEIIAKAWRGMKSAQIFDENFLMVIATFGAWGLGEYSEAVAVMLFFQIGEFFQSYAVNKSRASIASLMNIRPDYARIRRGTKWQEVSPEEAKVGDIILIRPGEKIPLDAVVVKGASTINTSALTGESMPSDVSVGSELISGCVNISGLLEAKVSSPYGESTVAKILNLVENASSRKAVMENFITRFARYYTPMVVLAAAVLAFLPPLIWPEERLVDWGYRAMTFLVISCPCALVISIPLSFFGGLGAASKNGVLVKGSNYLEALSMAKYVAFDKTGTLTEGVFHVEKIVPQKWLDNSQLLEYAAYGEAYSHHPIGESIRKAYAKELDLTRLDQAEEVAGLGLKVKLDGQDILIGNDKFMRQNGIVAEINESFGTAVFVAVDGRYAGYLLIADKLKAGVTEATQMLRACGVDKMVMLSGDRPAEVARIAKQAGVDEAYGALLPADKVAKVEELKTSVTGSGRLLFVGDGVNDAPVLALADVGVAMGGIGSDAAIEAADVVIMNDDLRKLPQAMAIARKTIVIARENIVFALGVKLLVLGLGAFGLASIWAAVFADVGVSVIAILNAMRASSCHHDARGGGEPPRALVSC